MQAAGGRVVGTGFAMGSRAAPAPGSAFPFSGKREVGGRRDIESRRGWEQRGLNGLLWRERRQSHDHSGPGTAGAWGRPAEPHRVPQYCSSGQMQAPGKQGASSASGYCPAGVTGEQWDTGEMYTRGSKLDR